MVMIYNDEARKARCMQDPACKTQHASAALCVHMLLQPHVHVFVARHCKGQRQFQVDQGEARQGIGCMQKHLHEGVSDRGHIGKVDGGINPDQQHAIYSFCLWVLVHIPTSTDTAQIFPIPNRLFPIQKMSGNKKTRLYIVDLLLLATPADAHQLAATCCNTDCSVSLLHRQTQRLLADAPSQVRALAPAVMNFQASNHQVCHVQ